MGRGALPDDPPGPPGRGGLREGGDAVGAEAVLALPQEHKPQNHVVHNIGCDKTGRVLVCDRENNRIQIFGPDGEFIEQWTDLAAPGDVWITDDNTLYVVEQGGYGHVSVWSPDGERISRFSGSPGGVLEAPHGICVDDEGSIYVAEIGGGDLGQRLQKFARV